MGRRCLRGADWRRQRRIVASTSLSVSYTHLDVYKRQVPGTLPYSALGRFGHFGKDCFQISAVELVAFMAEMTVDDGLSLCDQRLDFSAPN